MNKFFKIFILSFFAISIIACKKDDAPEPSLKVDKTSLVFSNAESIDTLTISSNLNWTVEENADWLSLSQTSGQGDAKIEVSVQKNAVTQARQTKIVLKAAGLPDVEIEVNQSKGLETVGLYILSEGTWGANNSELAYYDVKTSTLTKKYFDLKNSKALGDTGNDLAIYGSKMYCVVSGANSGGHIEIINPETGISQKRIPVTDNGTDVSPRNIIFHENKAYITTYSNSVIRLDTASLAIDGKAELSGNFAEGICKYNGKLYVCNSGQGYGTTISVVDIASFREVDQISVPQNPSSIVATSTGEIYFSTADASWAGGSASNLHILNPATKQVTRTFDIRTSRIALSNDCLYVVDYNWNDGSDSFHKVNLQTKTVADWGDKFTSMMIYGISVNPLNNDVYVTDMGQKVIGLDKDGNEKFELSVGTGNTSKVVAVIK